MPSFSMTVAHRPVRVGLLVRAKSAEDFIEAVSVCTGLWGGLHNPILPVSAGESPWIETIVRRFQVDVLASASDSSSRKASVDRPKLRSWISIRSRRERNGMRDSGQSPPPLSD